MYYISLVGCLEKFGYSEFRWLRDVTILVIYLWLFDEITEQIGVF